MTTRTENDRDKAVQLAQDILDQLEVGSLRAVAGRYEGSGIADYAAGHPDEQLQPKLLKTNCAVCAVGALVVAKCRRYNALTGRDYYESDLHELLQDVFSFKQAHLIEVAFEGTVYSWNSYFTGWDTPAQDFRSEYPDDTHRLQQICLNIIHNNGVFDPENHPEDLTAEE